MIALAAIIVWQPASANKTEFKRYEHFAYDVDNNSLLELLNHNGNIVIENTDESRLNIEATVTGKARNLDDAERIAQKIKIVVKSDNGKINISNDVPKSLKFEEFDISYVVTMPAWLNINLSNKYGNVMIDRLNGRTSIKVGYGELKIKELNDKTGGFPVVDLAYSRESEINEMNIGGVNMNYSGITIDRGQAVAVSSKYSKLTVGAAASIAIESAYDNLNIANTDKIDISTRYSKLQIGYVGVMANIGIEYDREFKNITVNAKYTDTDVDLKGVRNYSFDLNTKYGNITTPTHNLLSQEIVSHDSSKSAKGQAGNVVEGGKIRISAKYGSIKVRNSN